MTSLTNFLSSTRPESVVAVGGQIPSYTTVGNAYEEFITFQVVGLPRKTIALTAATNDLTFLIEGTGDNVGTTGWYSFGEFTILAGDSHVIVLSNNLHMMRVSVKPTGAGAHGTVTGYIRGNEDIGSPIRASFAYEAITITNAAALGFTRNTMDSAIEVMLTVESNPIRIRVDGVAPTTTEGHLLQSGDTLKLDSVIDALNFKAIATGGDGKIRVTYSR